MRIVVCIKQIPDPEAPLSIAPAGGPPDQPSPGQGRLVISPFDENALETAVQMKEQHAAEVLALSMGPKAADEALRRAMAMGADEAIRLDPVPYQDAPAVAEALARAVEALGPVDLVLVGRQAGDWDQGQVGPMLAEALGLPCVTAAFQPELRDGRLLVRREVSGGVDLVAVSLPAVVAVTNHDSNLPRYPTVRETLKAMRRQVRLLPLPASAPDPSVRVEELSPLLLEGECEWIAGEDGAMMAATLAGRLKAMKLI